MDRTLTAFLTDDHRWEALQQRDRAADGAFFYAVKTTGVYCRPTCASRVPNRKNVAFFDTWSAAEQAGFRSCKRCQPKAETLPEIVAIKRACEIIEAAETAPKLDALADAVGWSQYHFQRVFKRTVGVTPKDYFAAKRLRRLQDSLQQPSSVTEAIHEAGFGSISRVYEDTAGLLGMSPQTYKTGAVGVEIRFAVEESFIGWVLVAASDRGICAIE
ncbi:methylphosphotriester-DNA--protein-cysteine methyltransferase family protein, partial [Leptolyngbya sp. FACHB-36]|uniref:bifunctional transcriptional activator/DNA repair enzyme AdaA n=1 Tax=Leptolyngbya sp. FACHB-36 TaxID=2692808 RepID=UPI001680EFAD